MKKKVAIIVVVLTFLLIVGGSVVYFNSMVYETDPEFTTSPTPEDELPLEEEIIEYFPKTEYLCTKPSEERSLPNTNHTYTYQAQYYFSTGHNLIQTAEVRNQFNFSTKEIYDEFLNSQTNEETNFEYTYDEDNLTITNYLYMVIYPETTEDIDEFVFDDTYLTFLSQKGYTCELQKATTDKN